MTDEPATPLEVQERLHKDLTKMCNEYNIAHIVGLPPSLNDEIYTISFAKYLNECVSTYERTYIKNGRAPTDEEIHKLNEYYKSTLERLSE